MIGPNSSTSPDDAPSAGHPNPERGSISLHSLTERRVLASPNCPSKEPLLRALPVVHRAVLVMDCIGSCHYGETGIVGFGGAIPDVITSFTLQGGLVGLLAFNTRSVL